MGRVFTTLQRLLDGCLHVLSSHFARWTTPLWTSLPLSALTDLSRSKTELIAENALLRQQLIILVRHQGESVIWEEKVAIFSNGYPK